MPLTDNSFWYALSPLSAAGVTCNKYTEPSGSSAATIARRFWSAQALICCPCGVTLEPHAFCGHDAHKSFCGLVLSACGPIPSSEKQSGAVDSASGVHAFSYQVLDSFGLAPTITASSVLLSSTVSLLPSTMRKRAPLIEMRGKPSPSVAMPPDSDCASADGCPTLWAK